MIVGFNHNVNYKGVGFHVQTEDSGLKSPQLVTLLYHGGTIIASQKTVYADILKVENLNQVVEDLAKEQHKGMLRRLTQGEFDEKIVTLGIAITGVRPVTEADQEPVPEVVAEVETPTEEALAELAVEEVPQEGLDVAVADMIEEVPPAPPMVPEPPLEEVPEAVKIVAEPVVDKFRETKDRVKSEPSLNELIYAYLTGADQC